MQDLRKALADIDAIKGQVARATVFRGYGPATVALTGLVALFGALVQAFWLANPREDIAGYLTTWIGVAVVSAALIGGETITRSRRLHSGLADDMIYAAIEQLIPVAVAGALLTFVLVRYAPETTWMLPGLWQILYGLGIFASCRLLPKTLFVAGAWYLATGLICLAGGADGNSWSPWSMGLPFCGGQLMMAVILYRTLGDAPFEDGHGED
jgi:hypothetical protein